MDRYNPRGRHGGGMHIEKIYDDRKIPTDCPYYWSDDSVCGNVKSDRYLMICKFACKEWKKMKKTSEETNAAQNYTVEPEKKQRVSSKVSPSSNQSLQKKVQQLTLAVTIEKRQREAAETSYHNSEKEIIALRKALQNEKIKLNDKEVRIEILQRKLQAVENILGAKDREIKILQEKLQIVQQCNDKVDNDEVLNTINSEKTDTLENKIGIALTIALIIIIIVMIKFAVT